MKIKVLIMALPIAFLLIFNTVQGADLYKDACTKYGSDHALCRACINLKMNVCGEGNPATPAVALPMQSDQAFECDQLNDEELIQRVNAEAEFVRKVIELQNSELNKDVAARSVFYQNGDCSTLRERLEPRLKAIEELDLRTRYTVLETVHECVDQRRTKALAIMLERQARPTVYQKASALGDAQISIGGALQELSDQVAALAQAERSYRSDMEDCSQ